MGNGKIYLIGAGAGSKEQLTVKSYELIKTSDAIVYDRLIHESVLGLIPDSAEKIFAGKEPDKHHMTQDEINQCLLNLSSKYERVVRLKGGDPFIFGRGGEEAEFLKKHNVAFEIIPGISAFQLAAAGFNIPITFRGIANGFTVISGHSYDKDEPDLNWRDIAKSKNTIVLYMGVGNIDIICRKLIEAGMDVNTPCFAAQEIGYKNSQHIYSKLENFADDISIINIKNPAIIIIGKVVRKSQELNL